MQRYTGNKQTGATVVEYALIVAFIAMAVVVTVILVGKNLDNRYKEIVNCVESIQNGDADACS